MKPIVVNLMGGPGCGKSTGASYIFSKLKLAGINAELVTEFAKDKTWENNKKALQNQIYVFGKQYFKMDRVRDEVDVIITDSPLLLSLHYAKDDFKQGLSILIDEIEKDFDNYCYYLLNRVKKYNPKGRNQTELEAKQIDLKLEELLKSQSVCYKKVDDDENGYLKIVDDCLAYINQR